MNFKIKSYAYIAIFVSTWLIAQQTTGVVMDTDGIPLSDVEIFEENTTHGTVSAIDGSFRIQLNALPATLHFKALGFATQNVTIEQESSNLMIVMQESQLSLTEIVLVGSRNRNRTVINTPVPIDVIDVQSLSNNSPQTTVNEILNYVAPSFTSQPQTVSDGTDHLDPASLRGLGPDQILVLINGKRRHTSALINVNGTVGAGSVGTDLNSLPTAAIQRIEVLRDGAAAQYGSDAIAGVINIVLKKNTGALALNYITGAHLSTNANQFEGGADGERYKLDANYGLAIGEKGGFINFTGELSSRAPALRNKDYSGDIFRAYHGAERLFVASGGNVATMGLEDYQNIASGLTYLSSESKATISTLDLSSDSGVETLRELLDIDADEDELAARGLTRKDFRFKVGTSELREGKFFGNMSIPLSDQTSVYGFGGLSFRQGLASGFYRRPAQGDGRANTPAFPNGFLPNIGSTIVDQSIALGIQGKYKDWHVDFSNTYGSNRFAFTVGNSSNGTLGVATPRVFDAGELSFSQHTTNLDFDRDFSGVFKGIHLAFGVEYKIENFIISEGEEKSYTSYDKNGNVVNATTSEDLLVRNNFTGAVLGGSAQVFRGFDPNNAISKFRTNSAAYADVEVDLTDRLLSSFALRYEDYSDFGSVLSYKWAGRAKLTDQLSIRGAHSTGFRAPSLHQQYFSRTSTRFLDDVAVEQGTFTNDSRLAELIGIDPLDKETAFNLSGGLTIQLASFSITADLYQTKINDRIIYSGQISAPENTEIERIFEAAGASSARFFVNAVHTKTQGLDVVATNTIRFLPYSLKNTFSLSYNKTEVTKVNVPEQIDQAGLARSFFDAQEEAFLTLAIPRIKMGLSHRLSLNKGSLLIRNSYFGEVTDPDDYANVSRVADQDPSADAVYGAKIVTDVSFSYPLGENSTLVVGANNLLDVYPDENRAGGTSGDQFVYSRRTSQFGYMGRYVFARLRLEL